jgi:protein-S-isoprenylcysteine O-methyltransferase Ste14
VSDPQSRVAARAYAVALGIVCHATFASAIVCMAIGLYSGLQVGLGPFQGFEAVLANALLVGQFPIVHSYLLSRSGRRWLVRLAPASAGSTLATTTFATIASAQLLAVFLCWSPTGYVLYRPHGIALWANVLLFAASWTLLMKAIGDADVRVQTGYLGWSSFLRGAPPVFRDFPTAGTFRLCRQPIYLGFALVLWTAPVWTADRVALALALTMYCAFAPIHKEVRYLERYGDRFREYRERVPYIFPRIGS